MFRSLRNLICRALFVALVATSTSAAFAQDAPGAPSEPPAVETGSHLSQLLTEAGLAFTVDEYGRYRVLIESDGEASLVVLYEQEMGWNDENGNPVKLIYIFRNLASFPEGFEMPLAMYKKIVEINDHRTIGSVNASQYGLYIGGSLWMATASPTDVWTMCVLFHNDGERLEGELRPFIEEATQE